jgi:hypothetical protein
MVTLCLEPKDRRLARLVFIACLCVAALTLSVVIWALGPGKSRASLEAQYLALPTDYAQVLGLNVHFRDSGPKTAVNGSFSSKI